MEASEVKYEKLKNLVGKTFTVVGINGYKYKMWSEGEKRMVTRDDWAEGFRKLYQVDTDKGRLDLGTGQIGTLLEAVLDDGVAVLPGKTFEVKSNGKEGMEIRYYFNSITPPTTPAAPEPAKDVIVDSIPEGEVNLDEIPF